MTNDQIEAKLSDKVAAKFAELGTAYDALLNFSFNSNVKRLLEAAQKDLKRCFGEGCVVGMVSLEGDSFGKNTFYVELFAAVPYEDHLDHCGKRTSLTTETLTTYWDMEGAGLVQVSIRSTLPPEELLTLDALGKLHTHFDESPPYQTISCDINF